MFTQSVDKSEMISSISTNQKSTFPTNFGGVGDQATLNNCLKNPKATRLSLKQRNARTFLCIIADSHDWSLSIGGLLFSTLEEQSLVITPSNLQHLWWKSSYIPPDRITGSLEEEKINRNIVPPQQQPFKQFTKESGVRLGERIFLLGWKRRS